MVTQLDYASAAVEETLDLTGSYKKGLSPKAAKERLKQNGPNKIHSRRFKHPLLWLQLHKPLVIILIAATIFSTQGLDLRVPALLTIVIVINIIAYGYLEKSSLAFARSLAKLVRTKTTVIRGGRRLQLDSRELVVGDIICLGRGDIIPADLRIIEIEDLVLDKSNLGSSQASVKVRVSKVKKPTTAIDAPNLALTGMTVLNGKGRGVVIATGKETILNQLARGRSVLLPEQKLLGLTQGFIKVALSVAVLAVLVAWILQEDFPQTVTIAVTAVVAWLPLGLASTIVLLDTLFRQSKLNQRQFITVLQAAVTDTIMLGLITTFSIAGLFWLHMPLAVTALQMATFYIITQTLNLTAAGNEPKFHGLIETNIRLAFNFGLLAAALGYANFLLFFDRMNLSPLHLDMTSAIYEHAATQTFVTLALCHYINILFVRSEKQERFFTSYLWNNKSLLVSTALSLFVLANTLYNPLLQPHLGAQPLSATDWLFALGFATVYLVVRLTQRHTRQHTRSAVLELHKEVHQAT
jgi:magnesium-transporting ATPase (P-type)